MRQVIRYAVLVAGLVVSCYAVLEAGWCGLVVSHYAVLEAGWCGLVVSLAGLMRENTVQAADDVESLILAVLHGYSDHGSQNSVVAHSLGLFQVLPVPFFCLSHHFAF